MTSARADAGTFTVKPLAERRGLDRLGELDLARGRGRGARVRRRRAGRGRAREQRHHRGERQRAADRAVHLHLQVVAGVTPGARRAVRALARPRTRARQRAVGDERDEELQRRLVVGDRPQRVLVGLRDELRRPVGQREQAHARGLPRLALPRVAPLDRVLGVDGDPDAERRDHRRGDARAAARATDEADGELGAEDLARRRHLTRRAPPRDRGDHRLEVRVAGGDRVAVEVDAGHEQPVGAARERAWRCHRPERCGECDCSSSPAHRGDPHRNHLHPSSFSRA